MNLKYVSMGLVAPHMWLHVRGSVPHFFAWVVEILPKQWVWFPERYI